MEHKMLWGALLVGGAGWVCLLLLAALRRTSTSLVTAPGAHFSRAFSWFALALPVLVWMASLPTKAPFSSGQGYGRGFLLGGVVCWAGTFVVLHSAKNRGDRARLLALTSLFGAIFVACVPLLWMRHAVIEALLGGALGWVAVSLVWMSGLAAQEDEASATQTRFATVGVLNGAAWMTALCGVCALGFSRDFVVADVARGTHPAIALVLAASLGLALAFEMLTREIAFNGRPLAPSTARRIGFAAGTACLLVALFVGYLAATRLLDDLKVFGCVAVGAVAAILGRALFFEAARRTEAAQTAASPVAILVALCAFMLSFSLLQGFGVGLMILAAWPVSLAVLPFDETSEGEARLNVAQTLALIATFLVVLLLSRAFATRFRTELRGANLSDQFALFGFLAGAVVPALLASIASPSSNGRAAVSISMVRLAGAGTLALVLLSAMLAVWNIKIVPAFFAGLALGVVLCPLARWNSVGALFSLALALTLTQWSGRFLPLAELSRAQRIHFLEWGLALSIGLVVLFELGVRLATRHNRAEGDTLVKKVSS